MVKKTRGGRTQITPPSGTQEKPAGSAGKERSGGVRILKTGDPCPCCGMPIKLTDPDALRMLAIIADMLGLPEAGKGQIKETPADG